MENRLERPTRNRIFFIMQIILFVLLSALNPIISYFIIPLTDNNLAGDATKLQILYTANIFIGLIQLLITLELVLFEQRAGFIVQTILNAANMIFICILSILTRLYIVIPGISVSLVSFLVCLIIHLQLTQLRRNELKLERIAYIDVLTGLPNRNAQVRELDRCINGTDGYPKEQIFTLFLLDYDNFKMINEFLGHQIGDTFLIESLHHLRMYIGMETFISRVGDDRFLIILRGIKTEAEIVHFAEGLLNEVRSPFYYQGHDYHITACLGIARYPKDSATVDELLRQVEIALFRAKAKGKNCFVFFDGNMQKSLEHRMTLENKLFAAIKNKELYLEYQPQYHIPDRRLRGFEVLVRWDSPEMGNIAPADFIPLAEANGSIVAIGKWILREACTEFTKLKDLYNEPPTLSINLSVVQFADPDFLPTVKQVIEETHIDPASLEFEITESIFIKSQDRAKQLLLDLKALGCRISLDDFGTGYSSLSYLRTLPLDIVKIDKSFIDPIGTIPDEVNIVHSIIKMAHQLNLEVVAEGIEKLDQFDYLVRNGCDFIQGNYLGKPVVITAL